MKLATSMRAWPWTVGMALGTVAVGCDDDAVQKDAFTLRFAAIADGAEVGCGAALTGFGPDGADAVGINDLRFYVSAVRFLDAAGKDVPLTLDTNDFQYTQAAGSVALVDLTGNSVGACAQASAGSEGTARTNLVITGTTELARVKSVAFEVGVPQPLMKAVIAGNSIEGAPSPLGEMYWSWNSGYRHLVFNFGVTDADAATGGGFVHIGSTDCGPDDGNALTDREACTYVNTPRVVIADFDPTTDTIGVDLRALLSGLDFRAPIYDPDTFEVVGEGPGVSCHSMAMQPDCATVFGNVGLDLDDGTADASLDRVFVKAP